MDREQAKSFYESNKRPQLSFTSYYKYCFDFVGENQVMKVFAQFGGDHNDIYRFGVDTEPIILPATLEESEKDYGYIVITNKASGEEYRYIQD